MKTKKKTVFQGMERTKAGLRAVGRILWEPFAEKPHSHTKENARRLKKIENGILKPNT